MDAPSLPPKGAPPMTSSPQSTRSVLRNLLDVMDKHGLPHLPRDLVVRVIEACDDELAKQGRKGQR